MGVADRHYMQRARPPGGLAHSTVGRLLIACLVAFLLQTALSGSAPGTTRWFVLSREALAGGRVWTLVTYALLHADFSHLLWNGVGIWIFGDLLEGSMAPREFARFTFFAALFGGLAHVLTAAAPVWGVSGVVSAYLALAALRFPQTPFRLFFLPISFPLWLLAVVYIGGDVLGALRADDFVAHYAHLGGAAYGLVCWRVGRTVPSFSLRWLRSGGGVLRGSGGARSEKPAEPLLRSDAERARVDALLEKISREGISALSDDERAFLNEASKRYR